jgi:hypothetical protein
MTRFLSIMQTTFCDAAVEKSPFMKQRHKKSTSILMIQYFWHFLRLQVLSS